MKIDRRLSATFKKNFIICFALSIIPLIVFLSIFALYIGYWNKQQEMQLMFGMTENVASICDAITRETELKAIRLAEDNNIQTLIASGMDGRYMSDCVKMLKSYKIVTDYIHSIYVSNLKTGNTISDNGRVYSQEIQNEMQRLSQEKLQNETKLKALKDASGYPYIFRIIRTIKNGDISGAVLIDIDIKELCQYIENPNQTQLYMTYITINNMVMYSNNDMKQKFGTDIAQYIDEANAENADGLYGRDTTVEIKSSYYDDVSYVSLLMPGSNSTIIQTYALLLYISIFVTLILAVISVYYISKRSIGPLTELLTAIDKKDDQNIPIEIRYIAKDILSKVDKNQEAELGVRSLTLKIAHLQALGMQINPHFLSNTLDTLNWSAFIKLGKDNDISKSIGKISELLWICFNIDEYVVTLNQELYYAQLYGDILLQNEDYDISIDYDIKVDTEKIHTAKFVLQPLIENAVKHGIKPRRVGGKVLVAAYYKNDEVIIEISDNGIGMEDGEVKRMNEELLLAPNLTEEELEKIVTSGIQKRIAIASDATNAKFKNSGLGIKNVSDRIKLIFGEKYGLRLDKNMEGGMKVIINLPDGHMYS